MKNRKITLSIPPSKPPRNPLWAETRSLRSGVHGPSRKAVRHQQRQNMQRHINALLGGDKTEFDIDA